MGGHGPTICTFLVVGMRVCLKATNTNLLNDWKWSLDQTLLTVILFVTNSGVYTVACPDRLHFITSLWLSFEARRWLRVWLWLSGAWIEKSASHCWDETAQGYSDLSRAIPICFWKHGVITKAGDSIHTSAWKTTLPARVSLGRDEGRARRRPIVRSYKELLFCVLAIIGALLCS
jgi:hypothetical protein